MTEEEEEKTDTHPCSSCLRLAGKIRIPSLQCPRLVVLLLPLSLSFQYPTKTMTQHGLGDSANAESPAVVPPPSSKSSSYVKSLFLPSPDINYSVILFLYCCCGTLGLVFFLLQRFIEGRETGHWAKENLDAVEGIYIIFVPFAPGIAWAAIMRQLSRGEGPDIFNKKDKKD